MEGLNPVEWFGWIYGKVFQGHGIIGGIVIVGLWSFVGLILWVRAVDKYKEDHPKAMQVTDTSAAFSDSDGPEPPAQQAPPSSLKRSPSHKAPAKKKAATSATEPVPQVEGPKNPEPSESKPPISTSQAPQTPTGVHVAPGGEWNSTDDEVNAPNGIGIRDEGKINSRGLRVNPPVDYSGIYEQLNSYIAEGSRVQDSETQAWLEMVARFLRMHFPSMTADGFLSKRDIPAKIEFLKLCRDLQVR